MHTLTPNLPRTASRLGASGLTLALVLGVASLAGCGTNPSRQQIGTATGAVVGGLVGSSLTFGSTGGTVAGAAVGGVIGNEIGKNMEHRRR